MRKFSIIKALSLLLALGVAIYGIMVAPSKIYANNFAQQSDAKIILKLCHVDTFEGGTGSRKQYVLKVARSFERLNPNVLISVNSLTADNYYEQKDSYDLVSFGVGLAIKGASQINAEKYYNSGVIDGKVYAIPWAVGGYYILSKNSLNDSKIIEKAVISQSQYSSPYVALTLSDYTIKNYYEKSPVDAYADFITGQCSTMVGTQRDINRVLARGESCCVTPIDGFSDIVQYISVTSTGTEKSHIAQKFAKFLANEGQSTIGSIGMFSPYKKGVYSDGLLSVGEGVNITSTYHAFQDGAIIKAMNTACKDFSKIEENKKQIKKLLVYLDKNYRI